MPTSLQKLYNTYLPPSPPSPNMANKNNRHRKTTFLPLLCSSTKSISTNNDPFSPRITCTGQIKRSNKIAGIPTPQFQIQTSSRKNNVKYSKLRRLFSSNSFNYGRDGSENCGGGIRLEELDPPLPVVRGSKEEQGNTIWERRKSGGVELKSLQLQEIQLNRPPPLRLQSASIV